MPMQDGSITGEALSASACHERPVRVSALAGALVLWIIVASPASPALAGEPGPLPGPTDPGVPAPVPAAGANNRNNVTTAPLPGPGAVPHPGEFVLRLGGRLNVTGGMTSSGMNSPSASGGSPPAR